MMLLPFSRKIISIPNVSKRFLSTVLGDLKRDESSFSGYFLLHQEKSASVLLIEKLDVIASAYYSIQAGLSLNVCGCMPFSDTLDESISLEVMACDEQMFMLLKGVLMRLPQINYSHCSDLMKLSDEINAMPEVIVTRMDGPLAEISLWENGQFVTAYSYDESKRRYSSCLEKEWNKGYREGQPIWLTTPAPVVVNKPDLDDMNDPLMLTVDKYFALFNHIQSIMDDLYGNKTLQELTQQIEIFKQKYPPLYRGIYVNPETHKVNWERMIDNRSRVDIHFRYDKFPLYLDEILMVMVKMLFEKTKAEGVRRLRELVSNLKEYSIDKDTDSSARFFRKLEKVLRV